MRRSTPFSIERFAITAMCARACARVHAHACARVRTRDRRPAINAAPDEIESRPAFETYERHAAERGISLTRENASSYMIANELGIHFFERIGRARAPLSVGADGSLVCAADVPRGSMVSILDGDPNSMVAAARKAAEEARAGLDGDEAAGVLLFDCVCRGMILKDEFRREIDAARSVFPDVPIAGFLTYSESHAPTRPWKAGTTRPQS